MCLEDYMKIAKANAFRKVPGLKRIVIPEGVVAIEPSTFFNCRELEEVVIPESVQSIGEYAFGQCSKLKKMNLPCGLKNLGEVAFYRCCNLNMKVVIPEGVIVMPDGVFMQSGITELHIPHMMRRVKDYVFSECGSLETVFFAEGCESIGYGAFRSCKMLRRVVLPSTLKELGGSVFRNCTSLEEICIPSKNLSKISLSAFVCCYNLKRVLTMFGTFHFDRSDYPEYKRDGYEQDIGLDDVTFEPGVPEIYRNDKG